MSGSIIQHQNGDIEYDGVLVARMEGEGTVTDIRHESMTEQERIIARLNERLRKRETL